MTNRTVQTLGICAASLTAAYLTLVIMTVFFATLRTQYAVNISNEEASLGTLESGYLGALASVQSADPKALGYAAPVAERFVSAQSVALSRTGN